MGALLFYCISKHLSQRFKPELSSHQQQQAVVPQQRASPQYEEVVELKENQAYGPVQNIELTVSRFSCESLAPRDYPYPTKCTLKELIAEEIQWNPSITDTIGTQHFVRYSEVSLTQGLPVYFR